MSELSIEYLRECFRYDPADGQILWGDRPREHFRSEAAYQTHLRHRAGKAAGGIDASTGYAVVGINNKLLYAHRLAWALHHGEWPTIIDHVDGNKLNNAISNLRSVTKMENNKNARIAKNCASGTYGVTYAKRERKWRARVMVNYREVYCRYFDTKEEAIAARKQVEREYGFHENHGRHGIDLGEPVGKAA